MRKLNRTKSLRILLAIPLIFLFTSSPTTASALTPTDYLGTAAGFGVLASTPVISSTGITTITGTAGSQMGISPAASITDGGGTLTSGVQHLNDAAAIAARSDMSTGYTTLSGLVDNQPDPGVELGGQILPPGIYSHGTFGITTTLTLDGGGDPNAIFVFKSATTLITADSIASKVVLTGSAQACNVYWTVGTAATLGVGSTFIGHLLSVAAITAKTGALISGQLMSRDAAVTLDSNIIVNDNCATAAVIYHGNTSTGGAVPVDALSPYALASTVTVLGNTGVLVKTGNTFAGWNTAANGSGTSYAPAATFSIAADVDLYAQWAPITYTMTYNGNTFTGGAVPVDGLSPYVTGSSVTVLGNIGPLLKTGYSFSSWNTAANGSGASYSPAATFTILANTILYAQWSLDMHTVTFVGNGFTGGNTATQTGVSPTPLNPNGYTKSAFTFKNWNSMADGSGISVTDGIVYAFAENLTLYAQWTPVVVVTPTPTPTPTVTPTPTPTVTPTPTPTVTPTPTPTVTPTPTPTPTVTPTPTPTVTPTTEPISTETGGLLPDTGTPWNNLIGLGAVLVIAGGALWRRNGKHVWKGRVRKQS
jgi:uncharacterized repeat protein (TIGR02543 family)/LPXTG-motif cell wall-anchored protein